ncbi:hypothetical protein BJ741DRAFT_708081 [Chytriomyces cf. hyalinus JEL632]|nr:hypothetical protein BJ741DRAFT_708081 [Chytriomyces cf. hyalinus JEL632]
MDKLSSVVKHIQVHPDCSLDIKDHLSNPLFDTSVYSKGRKMNCLGKSKSPADARVLLPCCDNLEMEDFLFQYVPDTWPQLTWSNSLLPVVPTTGSAPVSVPGDGAYSVITSADDLDVLKTGLKQLDLHPRECLAFKKCANTIVFELDNLLCQRLQRKHSSNRAFVVISATAVVRKCSSPQCKDLQESSVKTAIGVFPADFKDVVKQLLNAGIQPLADVGLPVTDIVAQQRFPESNAVFMSVPVETFSLLSQYLVQFNKIEPIVEDDVLNQALFKSFNGLASDIGYVVSWQDPLRCCSVHGFHVLLVGVPFGFWKVGGVHYSNKSVLQKILRTTDVKLSDARSTCLNNIKKMLKHKDLSCILQMAADEFVENNPDFLTNLDAKKNLLGFSNGVYDLNKEHFRPAETDDNLSLCTGYPFPTEVELDIQAKIIGFLHSIFAGKTEVRYMLKFLASALGYNREEIFTIWTGTGGNGKGILAELLTSTLGVHSGYFHSIPATLLTSEPASANSPIPEILNLKGKRVVMGSEPDKAVSIKSSIMKLLTGNDWLCGCYLFSNKDINFSPQHTIILQTNAIPKMDAQDQAVWRRCRIQDFPHSFVKDPKRPHERKIDDKLKEEVKTWGPVAAARLV